VQPIQKAIRNYQWRSAEVALKIVQDVALNATTANFMARFSQPEYAES
jgi:hypothetical protein